MMFEDAIKSLGAEFGVELEPEDGVAVFTVSDDGDDSVDIVVREAEDHEHADISADLGELPADGAGELMMEMLEANHLFGGTGGGALSVEGSHAKLERRSSLAELGRGDGVGVLVPFLDSARRWRGIIAGDSEAND